MTTPTDTDTAPLRTFLIADVRGYTAFTANHGDEAGAELAAAFARLAREVVTDQGGEVVELRGDEVLASFISARQALRATAALQERAMEMLPAGIGIGVDAGEAVAVEGGYRGGALNLAARLASLAEPGEVLATETVTHLARRIDGLEYVARGAVPLKGLAEPVPVVQVLARRGDEAAASPAAALPTGGFLGSLPEVALVGRDAERTIIHTSIDAVAGGSGRVLLLAGEPGIGKTRLAQEATGEAYRRGFAIATGTCMEQHQAVPLYPFRDVLAALYAAAAPALQSQVPLRWPALARLLPSIHVPEAYEGPDDADRLFRAVAGFSEAVAATRPVLLAVDDLQWADISSLELLRHVAQHTRDDRVLVLGTYRDDEVSPGSPLQTLLYELHRAALAEEIDVGRLGRTDTVLLAESAAGERIPAVAAEQIYQRTEGNPFFVQEVVRSLQETGSWEVDVADIPLQGSVRALVERRAARLSGAAREALQEASVLGRQFSFDDMLALRSPQLSADEEEALEGALAQGVRAGLLREAGGDSYAFPHALTQQALYQEVLPRRRRRLHLAAAEALERRGVAQERAGEIAWHLLQAAELVRALPYAIAAGDQAEEVFAHREAERLYRLAAGIAWDLRTSGEGVDEQEAQILERLGGVVRTLGRYEEALEVLERAAQLYAGARDLAGERRVVAAVASIHALTGRPDEGRARILAVLQGSGEEPVGLQPVYTALALVFIVAGRHQLAIAAAQRAAEIARESDDERGLAEAEQRRAEALAELGRHADARRVLEQVVPLAERGNLDVLARALAGLGWAAVVGGSIREARRYHERALEIGQKMENPRAVAGLAYALAHDLYFLGEWEQAETLWRQAVTVAETLEMSGAAAIRALFGLLLAQQGRSEEAAVVLDEVEVSPDQVAGDPRLRSALTALAERDLLEGRPQRARERLEPIMEVADVDLLSVMVRALLAEGDLDRAEPLATAAASEAAASRNRVDFAEALLLQGMVRARRERTDEAGRLFDAARSLAERMPYPLLKGRVLLAWAEMSREQGAGAEAEDCLREARAIFERLGARLHLEQANRALAALAPA